MSETAVQDPAWYEALAEDNHRGLVPMVFLENAMPYRRGEIAGFVPADARAMHVAGQASPYLPKGAEVKATQRAGSRTTTDPRKAAAEAELARLNGIEVSPGIFAEDEILWIAKAKEILGADKDAQMGVDEARGVIENELRRRDEAAEAQTSAASGAVTSRSTRRST